MVARNHPAAIDRVQVHIKTPQLLQVIQHFIGVVIQRNALVSSMFQCQRAISGYLHRHNLDVGLAMPQVVVALKSAQLDGTLVDSSTVDATQPDAAPVAPHQEPALSLAEEERAPTPRAQQTSTASTSSTEASSAEVLDLAFADFDANPLDETLLDELAHALAG